MIAEIYLIVSFVFYYGLFELTHKRTSFFFTSIHTGYQSHREDKISLKTLDSLLLDDRYLEIFLSYNDVGFFPFKQHNISFFIFPFLVTNYYMFFVKI